MNENELMGSMKVSKAVAKMAIPSVISSLVTVVYNMADTFFVGQTGDPLQVAAVSLTNPIFILLMAFANMFGMGGSAVASMAMGEKNEKRVKNTSAFVTYASLIVGILFALILIFFMKPILYTFGANSQTYEMAKGYTFHVSYGAPFIIWSAAASFIVRAEGASSEAMIGSMIGTVVNIVLDPVFIFGMNLGVRGAAIATVISQACSTIWVLTFLTGSRTRLKIRLRNMGLTPSVILPCVALGAATFVMQSSESIISICFNSSLLKYGGDIAVGAMTILTSAMQFAMLPLQGLGQGAQPIISYNYGARNAERVKGAFGLLLKASLIYSTLIWLFVQVVPQVFAGMFTSDAELLSFTSRALRIYMACVFMFGIQVACQMAFTAIGFAKESIIVAVTRKFVLLLPLIYILPHVLTGNRTLAVYTAEPVADFLAVTFTALLFRKQFKKALSSLM